MKLQVTPEAARWFIEEMGLKPGDAIRFYTQLYGSTATNHHNFSLGIMRDTPPSNPAVSVEMEGITFFFTEGDKWFLDDYAMTITVENDEVRYLFQEDR